jgi:hypothetical protein
MSVVGGLVAMIRTGLRARLEDGLPLVRREIKKDSKKITTETQREEKTLMWFLSVTLWLFGLFQFNL